MSDQNILDPDEHLLLIDVETTGLIPAQELLLEVGLIIVTLDFKPVAVFSEVVRQDNLDWTDCTKVVRDMHRDSGLMTAIDEGKGLDIEVVEEKLIDWYRQYFGDAKVPLSGSSVHFDVGFIEEHFADFPDLIHYRQIDWSTVKELCRRYNPEVYAKVPDKLGAHRAIADLRDTIREANFYVENFLFTTRP